MTSKKGHWTGVTPDTEAYGFVYCITNLISGRKYIGRKFYHVYKKRKRTKESTWRMYTGSSKTLNEDIKALGKSNFTFTILHNYQTRGGLVHGEVNLQHYLNVLTDKFPDGTREYYNGQIGGVRFIAKEVMSSEDRRKISEGNKGKTLTKEHKAKLSKLRKEAEWNKGVRNPKYKGPYELTFKNGDVIVVNITLSKWADDNNYSQPCLSKLMRGSIKTHKDLVSVKEIKDA